MKIDSRALSNNDRWGLISSCRFLLATSLMISILKTLTFYSPSGASEAFTSRERYITSLNRNIKGRLRG